MSAMTSSVARYKWIRPFAKRSVVVDKRMTPSNFMTWSKACPKSRMSVVNARIDNPYLDAFAFDTTSVEFIHTAHLKSRSEFRFAAVSHRR
jgi:hypothetical protein